MDFLNDVVDKAKEVIDVTAKKTGEVVTAQKQKFDIASIESRRAKDFSALGELYYNKVKAGLSPENGTESIIAAIDEKNDKIRALKDELNAAKSKRFCPKCGVAVDDTAKYCNACGEQLIFDSEE